MYQPVKISSVLHGTVYATIDTPGAVMVMMPSYPPAFLSSSWFLPFLTAECFLSTPKIAANMLDLENPQKAKPTMRKYGAETGTDKGRR